MQVTVISGLFAIFFYLAASVIQANRLSSKKPESAEKARNLVFGFGISAVIAHGTSAWSVISTADGFHFGLFEISTLITASISLLVLVSSLRKPLENL